MHLVEELDDEEEKSREVWEADVSFLSTWLSTIDITAENESGP